MHNPKPQATSRHTSGWILTATLLALAAPLGAKFGVIKTHARYAVHHPPAFAIFDRQVRLELNSSEEGIAWGAIPRIRRALESGLARANYSVTPGARTQLEGTLTEAHAHMETEVRRESVNVHVGEHTVDEKNGKTKKVEDCKYQSSQVTYLISSGRITLQLKATDSREQALLLSQPLEQTYRMESAIAGPQPCGGKTYGLQEAQLNSSDAILALLADQISEQALILAAGFDENRDVLLEVDDELKPGNALAVAGAWPDALAAWSDAAPKSAPARAARQYNLGVAHQALSAAAARQEEFTEATTHLNQAQECFTQALRLDPGEKYFRDTLARVQADRDLLQKAIDQASQPPAGAASRPQ